MFNFNTLSTQVACDLLLTDAERDKTALLNRRNSLEFQIQNDSTDGGLSGQLTSAEDELAALDAALAALPAGTVRSNLEVERIEVNLRRARLQLRVDNADAYVGVNRQYMLQQVVARIAAVDGFITELQAHRETVPATLPNVA